MKASFRFSGGKINPKRIVVLGANGQLGKALRKQYPGAYFADSKELDITNRQKLLNHNWKKFKVIINAAAYTNVDGAETEKGLVSSWSVNANGVKNLTEVANKYNLVLVHVSSDYVFNGSKNIHTEHEELSPLNSYGASKAAGDLAAATAKFSYIIRTSWVIGDGKNFVNTMLDLAKKDISPAVVCDQIGRLTFTEELTRAIDHLLKNKLPYGTYNVTNSGDPASWSDITREIFNIIGREDLEVTDISTEEYFKGKEGIARRPLESTLDLYKIQSTGFESIDWREALISYIKK